MTSNAGALTTSPTAVSAGSRTAVPWPRDYRRVLQLALALIWLVDGVLQLQPFMFTPGANGFSGMLAGTADGNPHLIAHSITWSATVVAHHPVPLNTVFALVQIAIGIGIAWRPVLKPALLVSIAWSLGVWWFGEGLGGVLHGAGTPLFGGPGAVLLYALLAVLLWPADRAGERAPFVAARAIGVRAATAVWVVLWFLMAFLAVVGSGRRESFLAAGVQTINSGQPHWLGVLDNHTTTFVTNHGTGLAIALSALCVLIAVAVLMPGPALRIAVIVAVVAFAAIWVLTQNFGMILAGGATDPNSGPLVILVALSYWPLRHGTRTETATAAPSTDQETTA